MDTFIPEYGKPVRPGITMNPDNTVSVYHIVSEEDSFEVAAGAVFDLIRRAQTLYPDWPRVLYLDIRGHKQPHGGFEDDFVEFQQELLFSTMAPFLTALDTPLTGGLINPEPQRNDIPDELVIAPPDPGSRGR